MNLELPNWGRWIARDENKNLWVYETKPERTSRFWDSIDECESIQDPQNQLSFIKWEDNEPRTIQDVNFHIASTGVAKGLSDYSKAIDNARPPTVDELIELGRSVDNVDQGDNVNKPNHYIGIHGLEVEEVNRNFLPRYEDGYTSHRVGSALEYLLRAPLKNGLEDIKKAKQNLEQIIEHEEGKVSNE